MSDYDVCVHCGERRKEHGAENNPHRPFACPGKGSFPKWPKTIHDDKKAGALYDKRLAKFWSQRKTSFSASRNVALEQYQQELRLQRILGR